MRVCFSGGNSGSLVIHRATKEISGSGGGFSRSR
jgi:hypothetical protein